MNLFFRKDPSMSLNFAIFLHNNGDKSAALKQYKEFETRYKIQRASNPNAGDQEVGITSSNGNIYLKQLNQIETCKIVPILSLFNRCKRQLRS